MSENILKRLELRLLALFVKRHPDAAVYYKHGGYIEKRGRHLKKIFHVIRQNEKRKFEVMDEKPVESKRMDGYQWEL